VAALPGWLAQGETLLSQGQQWAAERGLPTDFGDLSSDLLTRTSKIASQLSQRLLGLLGATVGLTINTLIVLVLAVFLLFGGERISRGLAGWLPDADWPDGSPMACGSWWWTRCIAPSAATSPARCCWR
jgi:predicted PurR-regulated permease PerM